MVHGLFSTDRFGILDFSLFNCINLGQLIIHTLGQEVHFPLKSSIFFNFFSRQQHLLLGPIILFLEFSYNKYNEGNQKGGPWQDFLEGSTITIVFPTKINWHVLCHSNQGRIEILRKVLYSVIIDIILWQCTAKKVQSLKLILQLWYCMSNIR